MQVAAGSYAAAWQASIGNVAAGSIFAVLTSLGMTGMGIILTGSVGAALGLLASIASRLGWCSCEADRLDNMTLEELLRSNRDLLRGINRDQTEIDRKHHMIGYILQNTYAGLEVKSTENSFCIDDHEVFNFRDYFKKIRIDRSGALDYFSNQVLDEPTEFKRLNHLEFDHMKINSIQISCIEPTLKKVNALRLNVCEIEGDFYDKILSKCSQLTHLCVSSNAPESKIIGTNNDWMYKKCGKLEHFELFLFQEPEIAKFTKFLEENSKIKTFSTSIECFWANRSSLIDCKVELTDLIIFINFDTWEYFGQFWDDLNQLYERKFYKRLSLYYYSPECAQNMITQMAALKAVVKLKFMQCENRVDLSAFSQSVHLETLFIKSSDQIMDLQTMATNCINLKVIHFGTAQIAHIKILIEKAVNLSEIVIDHLINDNFADEQIIDLSLLNNKREGLDRAQIAKKDKKAKKAEKVTIFVQEEMYLATKRRMRNIDSNIDLSKVKLMRKESYGVDENFKIFG